MSRFSSARRRSILAWTGAALAWGTAVTTGKLEPIRATSEPSTSPPSTVAERVPVETTPVPNPPEKGLVILRYSPSVSQEPEVQTVYVRRTVTVSSGPVASSSSAAPAKSTPAPKSSGS